MSTNHSGPLTVEHKDSRLVFWLGKNNFIGRANAGPKDGPKKAVSNISMDGLSGGMMYIPDESYNEFLERYAAAMDSPQKMNTSCFYFVEKRTPVWKFLLDGDASNCARVMTQQEIHDVFDSIRDTIKLFYPPDTPPATFDMIILSASRDASEQKDGEEAPAIKQGFHPIMPNLLVTDEMALAMRPAIIFKLQKRFPNPKALGLNVSWNTFIDPTVYAANGLRMVYSRKCSKCPACNNDQKTRKGCETCVGKGKIDCGRVYTPLMFLSDVTDCENELEILQQNVCRLVKAVSLRTFGKTPTPGWAPYAGCPTSALEIGADKNDQNKVKIRYKDIHDEDKKGLAKFKDKVYLDPEIAKDKVFYDMVRPLIRRYDPRYAEVEVRKVVTNARRTKYMVTLDGEGSSFCMNKNADHRNNTVWFEFTKQGMRARCFCTCEEAEGRLYGFCRDFAGQEVTLPTECIRRMFPKPMFQSQSLLKIRNEGYRTRCTGSANTVNRIVDELTGIMLMTNDSKERVERKKAYKRRAEEEKSAGRKPRRKKNQPLGDHDMDDMEIEVIGGED